MSLTLLAACLALLPLPQEAQVERAEQWPQFRGPLGTGEAPRSNPPIEWSEEQNLRWKKELPGLGHSTPAVWGDRIFVTMAVPFGEKFEGKPDTAPGAHHNLRVTRKHRFVAMALSRKDGRVLWKKNLREARPHEGGHYTGSLASGSPVCDDKHVFVYFGSYGLYCLTHTGDLVWKKDLGLMYSKHAHGEASSPALHGDTVIVNRDHERQSFVVAFDKNTGERRWRKERSEVTSWTSPMVIEHKGQAQVVVAGTQRIRAYDLRNGELIWECGGLSNNVCTTPVFADGVLLIGSSYETRNFLAINVDGAKGDITGTSNVLWATRKGTPYVPSPLLYRGTVYFLTHYSGIMTGRNARTGEPKPGAIRLPIIQEVYSSPVAAAGRIYVTDLRGTTRVLEGGEKPKFLARNRLDDQFSATAAIAGDEIYLRGKRYLYCIAEELD